MKYQWIFEQQADYQKIEQFAEELRKGMKDKSKEFPKTIANLLIQRNIRTYKDAIKFFRPKLENLYDPFLMKDMDKAVVRLKRAVESFEKILVYGDYDTDGTTAVALMYSFLREFHDNIDFYIPDRYTEGYGISYKGIDYAEANEVSLVIALDCGIKAVDKIEYAKKKNIDFIICDHHTPGEKLPDAVAVLDPKRKDCNYPFKELTGCGIGFKLAQAFVEKYEIDNDLIFKHLDLVALSIAADIVPIVDENRILASFGLKQIMQTSKPGLKALLEIAGLSKQTEITISDLVFRISPRINAAGRLEHAKSSAMLLITNDFEYAEEISKKLNQLNTDRQNLDRQILEEALEQFKNNPELLEKKSTVLYNEEWHKGVIGIVASKVIEHFYKPTIILTKSEGKITGSGRSVDGFDLYEAISSCGHLLVNYGGHKYAAGLTLEEENLQKFIECFENAVKGNIRPEQEKPKLLVSDTLAFSQITPRLVEILSYFAPFGPENMKPVFFTSNVRDTGNSTLVGKDKKHIHLEMVDPTGFIVEGWAFNLAEYYPLIKEQPFDICYTINKLNNGKKGFYLNIKDLRIHY